MPATSSVSPTGNIYVDSVLTGTKWAVGTLTFSFPTKASYYGSGYGSGQPGNNFQAFNPEQKAATRTVLEGYEAVAKLTFTEIAETSTQHAALRLAEFEHAKHRLRLLPFDRSGRRRCLVQQLLRGVQQSAKRATTPGSPSPTSSAMRWASNTLMRSSARSARCPLAGIRSNTA